MLYVRIHTRRALYNPSNVPHPQVPQRPSLLPGTPQDFLTTILSYSSRHHTPKKAKDAPEGAGQPVWERALEISREWGMEGAMWRREWATLSGGEAQRMGLACAVALGMAEVLLLDGAFSLDLLWAARVLTGLGRADVGVGSRDDQKGGKDAVEFIAGWRQGTGP